MTRMRFGSGMAAGGLFVAALTSCASPNMPPPAEQAAVPAAAVPSQPSGAVERAPAMPQATQPMTAQDAERLRTQLADMQVAQAPRGVVVTISNALFKTNSAELNAGAAASLDRLAEYLKDRPVATVQVAGHTDSSRSGDYNIGFSQRRANAVRQALIARGVDPARIEARGVGAAEPVAGNETAEGRQLNRRVEVIIAPSGGQGQALEGATPAP
jgi:outer membrane protein OmpA-like peptidoglycan-associated protein